MNMYGYEIVCESDLAHHGIKGQKWGTRHWQNEDGTFNEAGKKRYFGSGGGDNYKPVGSGRSANRKTTASINNSAKNQQSTKAEKPKMSDETKKKLKTAAKIGAAVAGTALVAYGGYKLNKMAKDKLTSEYLRLGREHLIERDKNNFHADALARWAKESANTGEVPSWNTRNLERHRSEANRHDELYKLYTGIAAEGKYSTQEKIDALRRMARRR